MFLYTPLRSVKGCFSQLVYAECDRLQLRKDRKGSELTQPFSYKNSSTVHNADLADLVILSQLIEFLIILKDNLS